MFRRTKFFGNIRSTYIRLCNSLSAGRFYRLENGNALQLCTELLWKLTCEHDAFVQTIDVKEMCEDSGDGAEGDVFIPSG